MLNRGENQEPKKVLTGKYLPFVFTISEAISINAFDFKVWSIKSLNQSINSMIVALFSNLVLLSSDIQSLPVVTSVNAIR